LCVSKTLGLVLQLGVFAMIGEDVAAEPEAAAAAASDESSWTDADLPSLPYAPPAADCTWGARAPAFFDWQRVLPFLAPLLAWRRAVAAEACAPAAAAAALAWPEANLYDVAGGATWRVLPFLHTFPAAAPENSVWLAPAAAACPLTAALLRRVPGIRTALISRLGPRTRLAPHQGWAALSNDVLRVHMPLFVPGEADGGAPCCGVVVEEATRLHRTGDFLVFDDSKMHSAFNTHDTQTRVVLIFDVVRPPGVPRGEATGAATPELLALIDIFK